MVDSCLLALEGMGCLLDVADSLHQDMVFQDLLAMVDSHLKVLTMVDNRLRDLTMGESLLCHHLEDRHSVLTRP